LVSLVAMAKRKKDAEEARARAQQAPPGPITALGGAGGVIAEGQEDDDQPPPVAGDREWLWLEATSMKDVKAALNGKPDGTFLLRPQTDLAFLDKKPEPRVGGERTKSHAKRLQKYANAIKGKGGNPDGLFCMFPRTDKAPPGAGPCVMCVVYQGKATEHLCEKNADGIFTLNKKSTGCSDLDSMTQLLRKKQPFWPVPLTHYDKGPYVFPVPEKNPMASYKALEGLFKHKYALSVVFQGKATHHMVVAEPGKEAYVGNDAKTRRQFTATSLPALVQMLGNPGVKDTKGRPWPAPLTKPHVQFS